MGIVMIQNLKYSCSAKMLMAGICFALAVGPAAPAFSMETKKIEISQPEDVHLTCPQISREVSAMNDLINENREIAEDSEMTHTGVSVAKTVGSFLIGSLGGVLGVMAAGHLAGRVADEKTADAVAAEDSAKQRMSLMVGIFNTRSCIGPIQMAALVLPGESENALNNIEPAAGGDSKPRAPRYNE